MSKLKVENRAKVSSLTQYTTRTLVKEVRVVSYLKDHTCGGSTRLSSSIVKVEGRTNQIKVVVGKVNSAIKVGCAGPQGIQGEDGIGLPLPAESAYIPSTQTQVVDSIDILLYSGVTWMVTCRDTSGLIRMFTIVASYNGIHTNHVTFGFNGAKLPVGIDVSLLSGFISLSLFNNHSLDINVNLIKLLVGR